MNLVKMEEKENESPSGGGGAIPGDDASMLLVRADAEPKIDDAICYHSKSATFKKHWNRGEGNSCARTDLVFCRKPGSKFYEQCERKALAAKEEKNSRKQQEAGTSTAGLHPPLPTGSVLSSPDMNGFRPPSSSSQLPVLAVDQLRKLAEQTQQQAGFDQHNFLMSQAAAAHVQELERQRLMELKEKQREELMKREYNMAKNNAQMGKHGRCLYF